MIIIGADCNDPQTNETGIIVGAALAAALQPTVINPLGTMIIVGADCIHPKP